MKVNKLLIVPSDRIVRNRTAYSVLSGIARYFKSRFWSNLLPYDGEMQFYGDMPLILGKENVFVFGEYHKHYFLRSISDNCAYPSCCKTPEPRFISQEHLEDVIKEADVLLVSSRSGERGSVAIMKAKAGATPVAIIDFEDHESNYGSSDVRRELCRGFIYDREYDIYFKKDLPLGYKTETVLPLCPIPVRPESYEIGGITKEVDIFYSGRKRMERCQPERGEVVDVVRENFGNALILEHETRNSFVSTREYWANLSKCRMALSPSGRVWDSFRHCEVGLAKTAVLIAPTPYVETVGPYLEDGKNAVLYDTELRGRRYHLKNKSDFVHKVKHYLNNREELEKISEAWHRNVLSGHTILARSRYIIECLQRVL